MKLHPFGLLFVCAFLVNNQLVGQPKEQDKAYERPCDCRVLNDNRGGYVPEKDAGKVVADLLQLMRQHSSLKYTNSIVIRAAGCGAPEARSCPTNLTDTRQGEDTPLILYNNVFLNGINKKFELITRIDKHILAHEISHHVFGHLKNTDGEAVYSVNHPLNGTDATNMDRLLRRYKVTNTQAKEIQADFFGLWILSLTEKALDFEAFVSEFNTDYIRQYLEPNSIYSATHPRFNDRISAMRRFWKQLQIRKLQETGIGRGYFANSASVAYLELHPERAFWDLGFVLGSTITGNPRFSVNGAPVDGLLYIWPNAYNLYAGLQLTRFKLQSPVQFEAEATYSAQTYGTLINSGNAQQVLETLELRYLSAFPKVTWIPFGRRSNRFAAYGFDLFLSVGPIVRVPVGFTYQNHSTIIDPTNQPSLRFSVNPRFSVGVELLKKSFQPKNYKITLNYEWATIQLKTTPHPKALSHNLDITLHYSFARW